MNRFFSAMAQYSSTDWWRYAGFLLLNVAMATGGTYYITRNLPPVRDDSLRMFVLPMGIISLLLFTGLYPILRYLRPGVPRFLALYGAFNFALVALAIYFVTAQRSVVPIGELIARIASFVLLIVSFGHLYGFVPLLGIAAINRLFSRLLFPHPIAVG